MLLVVDSGNTNIVFAVHDGETWRGQWRGATIPGRTADEYAVWLLDLLSRAGLDPGDVTAAVIATVVPAALYHIKSLCQRYFGCEPLVIGEPGVDLGIKVLVDRPEEVGADRLVNAVAAHAAYRRPVIVVDFGTATTFDVVDGEGSYRGGAISPGINLSIEALHQAAAQLPRVAVRRPARVIGRATVPAMQSGIFWGYVGLVEGMVRRIREECVAEGIVAAPGEIEVLATGGLAPLFVGACEAIDHLDPDLTLRGLVIVHRRATGTARQGR
ncbi:MAG: type III pantothenate kinase [Proteobacteria bacterium]|nr:type III pantothenate kinase [Pseudomonadota bacterium]